MIVLAMLFALAAMFASAGILGPRTRRIPGGTRYTDPRISAPHFDKPDHELTEDEALNILVVKYPCGCVAHWESSPPSEWSCNDHIGAFHPTPPRFMLAANEALRRHRRNRYETP